MISQKGENFIFREGAEKFDETEAVARTSFLKHRENFSAVEHCELVAVGTTINNATSELVTPSGRAFMHICAFEVAASKSEWLSWESISCEGILAARSR